MTTKPSYTPALRFPDFLNDGEWEVKRLGEICIVNPPSKDIPEEFHYLDLESVVAGRIIGCNRIKREGAPSRAQRLVQKYDVLFQMVRPYQQNNLYFLLEDGQYVASTGYAVLRAKEGVSDSGYLYHIVHSKDFLSQVLQRCTGSNYPAINSSSLEDICVPFPPLPEQRRIAQALTALDELIAATNEKLEQMKVYKKGLMQKLFPAKGKKLPELRFKEFKKDGECEVKKLGDIFSLIRNGAMYNTNNTSGFPMSRIETISNGVIDYDRVGYSETELKDYRLNEGDILFSHINSLAHIGKVAYYDGSKVLYHGMNLLVLRCEKSFYPLYIFYLLNTEEMKIALRSIAKRAINQASISTKELAQLLVYIPQKEEQRKIADCFTSIDEMINQYTNKVSFLEVYKKGLMQQMFPHVETQNFASLPTDKQM